MRRSSKEIHKSLPLGIMTKVSDFMRKLFQKDDQGDRGLQLRLRKAVILGKIGQAAAMLKAGASPVWMEDEPHSSRRFRRDPCQLNALLLACRHGEVEMLSLLLDTLFKEPQVVAHFSRAMYCLVIRHDHWKAFQKLQQRRVPMNLVSYRSPTDSTGISTHAASTQHLSAAEMELPSSKLPMPIFVAAEHGRHHILCYLLDHYPRDWAHYTFEGHSLLSVATINGHYECVRVLLERDVATGKILDAAVAIARRHHQAHVLVLLTSYLPEFVSDPEPVYITSAELPPSNDNKNSPCYQLQWPNQFTRIQDRGSITETVSSEFDDDCRRSSLLTANSPINYNYEMEREQRELGMTWFMDESDPVEEIQSRVDPYGLSADGFGVPKSARGIVTSFNNSCTSSYQEDEEWYAVKYSDANRQKHDDLLASEEEEEENSYESMFSVHEDEANDMSDELVPRFEETHKEMAAPRSSSAIVRSGRSRKLISVRSHGFQHKVLAAIEEHPAGETEA